MSEDSYCTQNVETRAIAMGMANKFAVLETAILTAMWDRILNSFN